MCNRIKYTVEMKLINYIVLLGILRLLDRLHAAGISLVALSFYIIKIYLNRAAIPTTIYLLRVQTEISWSHSTIRGNVYSGTSQ
jgi:hypothetical protein